MPKATKKKAIELEESPEGVRVVLSFKNGDDYEGIFNGMDGNDIMLKSISGDNMIGLPIKHLSHYYEITEN